jgi:hypothetical protein
MSTSRVVDSHRWLFVVSLFLSLSVEVEISLHTHPLSVSYILTLALTHSLVLLSVLPLALIVQPHPDLPTLERTTPPY